MGFLGPNGAGKTTTIRMLVTLLPPTAGIATVAGADLLRQPGEVRRRIGYVAQGGGSDPTVTGRSELVLQARLFGASRSAARAAADRLLERFDLTACADRPSGTWSGGQRRRLDLALGLVHRPKLVFLDEPTTGLDPQSRANLWDEIRDLRWNGTTVLLTTHYLEEADALCDRLAILDGGRIVAEGTPDELKRQIAGDVVTVVVDGEDGPDALKLLAAEPFVRDASLTDGEVRLSWSGVRPRRRSCCASSTAPGWPPTRCPSTVPASTTCSCSRPAGRCATRPEGDPPCTPFDNLVDDLADDPVDTWPSAATPGSPSSGRWARPSATRCGSS